MTLVSAEAFARLGSLQTERHFEMISLLIVITSSVRGAYILSTSDDILSLPSTLYDIDMLTLTADLCHPTATIHIYRSSSGALHHHYSAFSTYLLMACRYLYFLMNVSIGVPSVALPQLNILINLVVDKPLHFLLL